MRRTSQGSHTQPISLCGNPSGSRLECMYVRSKSTPFRTQGHGVSRDMGFLAAVIQR